MEAKEIKIGKHVVRVLEELPPLPFGGNPQYYVEVDGRGMPTFLQGMICIWAFNDRPSWSNADAEAFDKFMDEVRGI